MKACRAILLARAALLSLLVPGWAALAASPPGNPPAKDAAKRASRAVWGVVPEAPRYKKDLRPGSIQGSAVAVAADTLLTSCRVVGKRAQVGLVRHAKYYKARVERPGPPGSPRSEVCRLRVAGAPLTLASGLREMADLRLGEPVFALVNRTSAEFVLASGALVDKGGPARARLGADLALLAGTRSAVLFDANGNLLAIAAAGRAGTPPAPTAATPITADLAPMLASRTIGPVVAQGAVVARVTTATPSAAGSLVPPVLILVDGIDADDAADYPAPAVPYYRTAIATDADRRPAGGDNRSVDGGRSAGRATNVGAASSVESAAAPRGAADESGDARSRSVPGAAAGVAGSRATGRSVGSDPSDGARGANPAGSTSSTSGTGGTISGTASVRSAGDDDSYGRGTGTGVGSRGTSRSVSGNTGDDSAGARADNHGGGPDGSAASVSSDDDDDYDGGTVSAGSGRASSSGADNRDDQGSDRSGGPGSSAGRGSGGRGTDNGADGDSGRGSGRSGSGSGSGGRGSGGGGGSSGGGGHGGKSH